MKVVYIHGLNSSPKIFNHLHSQLPRHKAIWAEYSSFGPVEDSYNTVIAQIPKNEEVAIISHSLGGILGHLISSRSNGVDVVQLVSISTPFGGSFPALGVGILFPKHQIFKDISPISKIIKEVNKPVDNHLVVMSLQGSLPIMMDQNDGVVSVKSQDFPFATKKVEVGANHFEVVQDTNTIEAVKNFLF